MSPSRSFLALICFAALGAAPNIAHAMIPPGGAAAGAANPGHGWIPGHHINPMLESGHASIMAKNFGAPYWRALRMRLIMALTAAGPGLWDIMVNVGAAANPPVTVSVIDGRTVSAKSTHFLPSALRPSSPGHRTAPPA